VAEVRTKVAEGGRIVIPVEYRRALGMDVGDEVILRLGEGELTVLTPRQAIRRAQQLVRRYIPEGRRLAEELISERREEVTGG